ncbi:hypothetical protein BOTBODRAFT_621434, partial [Botryobasidium botryosum FD-172 SS1]
LGTVLQILLFLPLTLSTLSKSAFLLLSLLLTLHSLIHSTMAVVAPILNTALPILQLPMHPFLLLLSFNLFSEPIPTLFKAADLWGTALRYWTPVFVGMEGLASLVLVQSSGRKGRLWAERSEAAQFGLLVGAAAAYVGSAWWIVSTYSSVATSPLSSTLLGAALTSLIFLTLIGFVLRRTNVIESAGLALYLAYNVWLCADTHDSDMPWLHFSAAYTPLLSNLVPHLQSLLNFLTHTLPKPLLISLLYRLTVLHFVSQILPSIGGDSWDDEDGVDGSWEERPVGFHTRFCSKLTKILLSYRQTLLITVYSHLLLLDHPSQVWWRWGNIFFTLATWAIEILLTGEEDELGVGGKEWKVE